jgi:hypothetical protein
MRVVVVVSKNYDTLIRKWFINEKSRKREGEKQLHEIN